MSKSNNTRGAAIEKGYCIKLCQKFTNENKVEAKQPRLQLQLKKSRPATMKISTFHLENLDLSS